MGQEGEMEEGLLEELEDGQEKNYSVRNTFNTLS